MHKNMNAGIRGGLFEGKHIASMGRALGLFGWLIMRQTDHTGKILYGKPLTYAEIADDLGPPVTRHMVEKWTRRLEALQYVGVKYCAYKKLILTVLNPKKFLNQQLRLMMRQNGASSSAKTAHHGAKTAFPIRRYSISNKKIEPRAQRARPVSSETRVGQGPETQTKFCELCGRPALWHRSRARKESTYDDGHAFREKELEKVCI